MQFEEWHQVHAAKNKLPNIDNAANFPICSNSLPIPLSTLQNFNHLLH